MPPATPPPATRPLARGEIEHLPKSNQNVFKSALTVNDPELGRIAVHIIVVEHPPGYPKEIFLAVGRTGQPTHEFSRDLGMAWSRMLRLGMSVDALVADLIGEKGIVRGMTDHPLFKSVLSVKDLVGKLLAYEYLGRTDFINPELLAEYRSNPENPGPRCVELELMRQFRQARMKRLTDFAQESDS